jgi:hypothetical protein
MPTALLVVGLGSLTGRYLFIERRGYLRFPGARELIGLLADLLPWVVVIGSREGTRNVRCRSSY